MSVAPDKSETREDDPRLLRAAQEYLAAIEAGARPARAEFVARFPDIAAELGPYLDALDLFHTATPQRPTAEEKASSGPAVDDSLPAEPLGDFRIVRRIGRGGMGIVYEAVQLSLGRRVALKVLPFAAAVDPTHLQRFKNEAQAAAQLHHTNIVPVYAVGSERGVHYYAMQLIEGQNLADVIRAMRPAEKSQGQPITSEPITTDELVATVTAVAAELSTQRATRSENYYRMVAELAIQAAEALEHAHQFGVIHRDVKPANLMVDARGNVWVADFGLAQFHTGVGLTRTGDLLGTLRYMSPEQAAGQGAPLDARTDVYSLGATLYELLTLEPLFDGNEHHRLLRQILNDEPKPPRTVDPAVPAELETIVLKAVSKNPADRYPTAKQLADDLRRFLDNRPILARRPTLAQRLKKWARRHPSFIAASVVLLLLVATGSLVAAALIRVEQRKAEAAYEREKQRAQEAEARFRLAKRSVDEMIQVSEEELADKPNLQGLRKRLLESALVYYQEFIDQRRDDPAAQEELRETVARVERILADLGVLQGAGRLFVLTQGAVQEDLKLSDEQRKTIAGLRDQGIEAFRGFHELPADERRQRFLEMARTNDAAMRKVLSPEQAKRLQQIALQLQGTGAFRDPDVVAALKLTAEQRERIRSIEADTFFGPPPPERPRPGPPDEFRNGFQEKVRVATERIRGLLTPEQVRRWKELTGEPFTGPPMMFFAGPGPFGPPPPR